MVGRYRFSCFPAHVNYSMSTPSLLASVFCRFVLGICHAKPRFCLYQGLPVFRENPKQAFVPTTKKENKRNPEVPGTLWSRKA